MHNNSENSVNILLIDIETAPNVAHVWGLFKQNIGLNQLMDTSYVMCVSAAWLGEEPDFRRVKYKKNGEVVPKSVKSMLEWVHGLLDQADIVIHYNGTKFDMPTLNKEFLLFLMSPPDPYKEVDLLKTARGRFRFPSNKLDHIARELGLTGKVSHWGHELWVRCMQNDDEAWELMEEYNKQDVKLLEDVYYEFLPWIKGHPNMALLRGRTDANTPVCTNCGSAHVIKKGTGVNGTGIYQRFKCQACGTPLRSRYRENGKNENILTQA